MSNESSGNGYGPIIVFALGFLSALGIAFLILKSKETAAQQAPVSYIPQFTPQLAPPQFCPPQAQPAAIIPAVPAAEVAGYKNNEDWVLDYDKDGFITSIKVIRDAKCLTGGG